VQLLKLIPVVLLSVFGTPAAAQADWPTYQGANNRAGVASGAPAFTGLQPRFARRVDGQVYAQPLISGGRIYVATENNTIYAYTTDGRLVFRRHFGAPVPGSDLPCGNIDPSGITATPVIAAGRVFVVAFLKRGHRHVLYGVDPASGRVVLRRVVDPANRIVQQQRGALLADHGRIYVPYGGLYGDCGPYRGVVVSVTTSGGGKIAYVNPAREAGIWAPGGLSEEPSGDLLVATGNGAASGGGFAFGNSVIRLSPTLSRKAYWAPTDWSALSSSDTDVGSVEPLPLPGGRVLQSGKNGLGYLLTPGLGGIGGEAFKQRICGGAYGAPAVSAPFVLMPCTDSLVAVRITGDRFSVAWRADGQAATPVIAGDTVLYVQPGGGRLRALRLSDGQPRASQDLNSGATSFPAVAVSGDLVVATAGRGFAVFGGA